MHELAIVESIVEIVQQEMQANNLQRVERIVLRIGEMRQVVPEAMHFGFECVTKDTPLEGAELIIQNVPVMGKCANCGTEFQYKNWLDNCPKCQHPVIKIISGKELEIVEFEGS